MNHPGVGFEWLSWCQCHSLWYGAMNKGCFSGGRPSVPTWTWERSCELARQKRQIVFTAIFQLIFFNAYIRMTIILFYLCIIYLLSAHYKLDTVHCRWSVNKTEWYPCSAVVGLWVSSSNCLEVGNKCQQQKQRMGDKDWEFWEKGNKWKIVTQECRITWPLEICCHKSKVRQVCVVACFSPSPVQLHWCRHERGKNLYLGRFMV